MVDMEVIARSALCLSLSSSAPLITTVGPLTSKWPQRSALRFQRC